MKNSFIFYNEWEQSLSNLTNEELGDLMRAILEYQRTAQAPKLSPMLQMAFAFIKSALDRDSEKYELVLQKRSDAGKKGMAKRWNKSITNDNNAKQGITKITNDNKHNKRKQTITNITNITVNENENVNENVNVNESVNVNENENVKAHACVVNLSHEKFLQTFPNKKIDGELLPGQNMDDLINAINRSQFLKSSNNLGLKWFVEHYAEVINDNYKDYETTKKTKKQDNDLKKAMERLGVNENE